MHEVNRFTVETGEYLDRFASKAQGKLLQLGQRLERLERRARHADGCRGWPGSEVSHPWIWHCDQSETSIWTGQTCQSLDSKGYRLEHWSREHKESGSAADDLWLIMG